MALIRRLAALAALLLSLVASLGWTMLGGLVLIGVLIAGWSANRIRRGP